MTSPSPSRDNTGRRKGNSEEAQALSSHVDTCNEHLLYIARRQRARGVPRQYLMITPGEAQKPWETVEGSLAPTEAPGWEELK